MEESTEDITQNTTTLYSSMTPKMMVQLAAPHTWPAAIIPVLFSVAYAVSLKGSISVILSIALLAICILMQAAVNTVNDYYDFVKGADSEENQDDPTDAVLVYNNINPRSAFILALSFLGVGALIGIYVIVCSGWIPLLIGIIGAVIIMLYSAGKSPISYLPLGEYVSAITMGGLIPLACCYVLTGDFNWWVLLLSFPVMCGIGLIMFTNNTCDIDKDIDAGRKTQSVLLGHERALKAYHGVMFVWVTALIVLVGIFYPSGLLLVPFMLIILYPTMSMLYKNPLMPETRGPAMGACLNMNIGLGIFYAAALLLDASGVLIL